MGPKLRLVIAEDETLVRMNLKETLIELGYLVIGEASDGVQAIDLTRQLRPHLVLMDIKMPHLDGLQAATVLHEERLAPVVLLTAYVDRQQVAEARDSGVYNYIVKPFRDSDLMPAIEIAFARYTSLQRADRQMNDLTNALETRTLVDQAKKVLMTTRRLKEHEAFRRMQVLSMNSRLPIRDIAQAILLSSQIETH